MNEDEIKQKVGEEAYQVLRQGGTEMPGTGKYVHEKSDGTYACLVCDNPLFTASSKFDSGTGWPSFDEPILGSVINIHDESHGMSRVEIRCAKCGSHLGHVFNDGPTSTGQRYCINSVCLDLKKEE